MADVRVAVAMAGSAGALQVMFDQVRSLVQPDSSALFLLYHRATDAPSDWSRLLPRDSGFQVRPLQPGPVQPRTIYHTASGVTYGVRNGRIEELAGNAPPRPNLDACLAALAQEYGPRLVGVLLSGWGRDGVAGMKAVRGYGGTAIVQDPATAEVGQLPEAALVRGIAQAVLPPEAIVDEIEKVLRGVAGNLAPGGR